MRDRDANAQVAGVRTWYNLIAKDFQRRYEGAEREYWRGFEDRLYDEMVDCRGRKVLDLGSGGGRFSFRIAPVASEVHGVDISEEMIRIANHEKERIGHSHLHFSVGDARNLQFDAGAFDVVVSAGMFEYLDNPAPFLREVQRVLRPGGVFLFTCYRRQSSMFVARAYRTLLSRALGRLTVEGESEYAKQTAVRESLYQKAYHRFAVLEDRLENAGFEGIEYRSTFHGVPTLLFHAGSRAGSPGVKRLAADLNCLLGESAATKWMGSVMVVKGTKSA